MSDQGSTLERAGSGESVPPSPPAPVAPGLDQPVTGETTPVEVQAMIRPEYVPGRRSLVFGATALTVVLVGVGLDLLNDFTIAGPLHLELELVGVVLWLAGSYAIVRALRSSHARSRDLAERLARTIIENARSQHRAHQVLSGLSQAIDAQFSRWSLSPSEREVAMLLLKGLSLKEVAGARRASEATVRQQAQSVYRKAHVSGRAELSAHFLEDLLMPETADRDRAATRPPKRASE
jgi:DNA-binding CsgD family transcriptional regulator